MEAARSRSRRIFFRKMAISDAANMPIDRIGDTESRRKSRSKLWEGCKALSSQEFRFHDTVDVRRAVVVVRKERLEKSNRSTSRALRDRHERLIVRTNVIR